MSITGERRTRRRWLIAPLLSSVWLLTTLVAPTQADMLSSSTLTDPAGLADDSLGFAVAVDGERAAIGALASDNGAIDDGRVLVYRRDGSGDWLIEATLTLGDTERGDNLGRSVALEGDRLVVGAPGRDRGGAVYLYERGSDGTWGTGLRIAPADDQLRRRFGEAVALDGDRLLIGAPGDTDAVAEGGAVYLFERSAGGSWVETAKLRAVDQVRSGRFGDSVALSEDRLVVGAKAVAYAFERVEGAGWGQGVALLPPTASTFDAFSWKVALQGDIVLLGVVGDGRVERGSAHAFERIDRDAWVEVRTFAPFDTSEGDRFGSDVAIAGDRALVGALGETGAVQLSGTVYLFERTDDGGWDTGRRLIAADAAVGDLFGRAVALSERRALVGAPWVDDAQGRRDTGAAYVFELEGLDAPVLVSPVAGTVLGGTSETFSWSGPDDDSLDWWLYVGNATGNAAHFDSGLLDRSARSVQVDTLPGDGRDVIATLYYRAPGQG